MCFAPGLPKVLRGRQFLTRLASKGASRHSCVQFLNFSTTKSAWELRCFYNFDFEMRFAPQTACTFWAAQLPKVLRGVFNILAVWLSNVLCTRTARAFSTFQSAKAARSWDSTSEFASRHSGMQFFDLSCRHMAPHPHFCEPNFQSSGATKYWKNTVLCDFSTFPRTSIFFLLTLSLLAFSSSDLFSSLTALTTAAASVHIVGNLTSKLPSANLFSRAS